MSDIPSDFHYDLPPEAVAQHPVEPRDAARLLVAADPLGAVEHRRVCDLDGFVWPGDVVVVNETRVLAARLSLSKRTGGAVEVLLLEPWSSTGGGAVGRASEAQAAAASDEAGPAVWSCLVRPGRRVPDGTPLEADGRVVATVVGSLDGGRRLVRLHDGIPADRAEVPLPPYVTERLADQERYQTVYARSPGSVAAPTAGLHLTTALLDRVRAAGATVMAVDLAVGLGTFRPLGEGGLDAHVMHEERYRVPEAVLDACLAAPRVLAVGTTSVRALESAAATGALEGRTDLFIRPGFEFRVVDLLLTNFHLPRSTLLVLLEAFVGPRWRDLYATALDEGYRFLSFGDAMLVGRSV